MSINNATLTMDTVQNNRGIIAVTNYGHQHNCYHHNPDQARMTALFRLRDRFFLSDPAVDRQALIDKIGGRVPGTCEWIKEHTEYMTWLSGLSPPLWITGGPGKGKTTMATYLAVRIKEHIKLANSSRSPTISVYYYFCNPKDDNRNSAVATLRGIIYQIIREDPSIAELIVADMAGDKESKWVLASRESLWTLIEIILDGIRLPDVCFLVDGLDECDQDSVEFLRQKILRLTFKCNRSGTTRTFRWIVLSRPGLGRLSGFIHISLDDLQDKISQEIERVVVFTIDIKVITSTTKMTAIEELRHLIHECGHIVKVQGDQVSLVHNSAKKSLCRASMVHSCLDIFQISNIEAHYEMASRCIEYLESSGIKTYTLDSFPHAQELDKDSVTAFEFEFKRLKFLKYAVENWSRHVHES
jgi:hypothetical protein